MWDVVLAVLAIGGGFYLAVIASKRAVDHTIELASGTRLPRFVIGFTLLAIGTDLPEIANSIVTSITGHGDLNVGDSVGSAATQITLILGLLPILGGGILAISRRHIVRVGLVTVGALLIGAGLMLDGHLSRVDAIVLLIAWVVGTALTWLPPPEGTQLDLQLRATHRVRKAAVVLGALAFVAVGSVVAVWGMTTIAEVLSVPEYLIAFFLASIGTSLPEFVVSVTALRRGQRDLAIGDVTGATFVDSTLSIAAGPLIAPVAVTASFVVRGSLIAAAAVLVVVTVLALRKRHDWKTGVFFVIIYLGLYVLLLAA